VILSTLALAGCGPLHLIGYWLFPDEPAFSDGATVSLAGLQGKVEVTQRADGLWKISAAGEADAMRVQGYLVARDRMFQLDLMRHMARGELAALLGDRPMGERTALQSDILNRFLGLKAGAETLLAATSQTERQLLDAYTSGINAWIREGQRSIEHRLLGVESLRPWQPVDSLSIYLLLMHSLSGNADREIRRLRIACDAGLGAVEQVFPTSVLFDDATFLPEEYGNDVYAVAPAVVPEIRAELPVLCAQGREDAGMNAVSHNFRATLGNGLALLGGLSSLSASNNWVVAGVHTSSGKPILSSDPHLPHMNPPIVWGFEMETPGQHVAGFTIPGLHRVVFGHNGSVAWGATTNHVDRQDLVVLRGRSRDSNGRFTGHEIDGREVPFEVRRESFMVKDGEPMEVAVRFTADGPVLNDIDPAARGRVPLTALRVASLGAGRDIDGAAMVNRARTIADFAEGIALYDQGCSNWVFADSAGGIGYRSPCRLPIRNGWRGTFPIPGWLSRYQWQGYVPKDRLPSLTNPERGWIATANSDIVPPDRFFTTYNNDSSAPLRVSRIRTLLHETAGALAPETSAAIQLDTALPGWPAIRDDAAARFCDGAPMGGNEDSWRRMLCDWDGNTTADSVTPTLFVLWSNAVLDRALADALPQGRDTDTWHFVQALPQFESVAQWLWLRPENDGIWDDLTTPEAEQRTDILTAAFHEAVAALQQRGWTDGKAGQWGEARPFVLRHPFATNDGFLGRLFNSEPLALGGDTETVFKQQFVRADRERLVAAIGPVVRFTIDMAAPWQATYTLAGGESGWPATARYGSLLGDWSIGHGRPLTPTDAEPGSVRIQFVPG
jgi:penicillin amidase